jgi:hypothetical protein
VRWRYYFLSFCSGLCRDSYKKDWDRQKALLKFLYSEP